MVPRSRSAWVVLALAFAVPLAYAAFAQHAWEDYYITLRASRNLVEGHGLVFNPGDRLHTFTSPLGVLVPALCTWLAGPHHEEIALWIFRFLSAALIAAAAHLAWRRGASLGLGRFGRVTFLGLLLTDAKLMEFGTDGMETAIIVFFAVFLWSELERPEGPRPGRLALAFGGLMWTRPDAFILAGALALPHLVLRARPDGSRAVPWRAFLGGAIAGGAIYLPWFAWAWWYYGTPIPHTIVAKSQVTPTMSVWSVARMPWRTLIGDSIFRDIFLPPYWFYGGWPQALPIFAFALSVAVPFVWLAPKLSVAARRLSLAVFLGMFYFCSIILFPWYSPPWAVLAMLTLAFTADQIVAHAAAAGHKTFVSVARIVASLAIAIQAGVLAATAWEMREQQQIIEGTVRQEIGEWLHAHAAAGDTVFLEPLGYIGYYSQLKMYDYPGLSSREVVAQTRAGRTRLTEVIAALRPTWLVLRPFEIADKTKPKNAALNDYELVRVWDARPRLDAVQFLPGRAWMEHDAEFRVFRRKDAVR